MSDIYFLTVDELKQKCQTEYADVSWSELQEMIKKADQTAFCKSLLGKLPDELTQMLEALEAEQKPFRKSVCLHYKQTTHAGFNWSGEAYKKKLKELDKKFLTDLFVNEVLRQKMLHIQEKLDYPLPGWNQEGGGYPVWVDPETGVVHHYTKV